jgi:hypothetical protein
MTAPTLRTPNDVVAAVPYLFGFHPADSLVVLAVRDGRLVLQLRVDLPPPSLVAATTAQVAQTIARHAPTGVIIMGYGLVVTIAGTLRAVRAAMGALRVPVLDVLRVCGDRFWRLRGGQLEPAPPEGYAVRPASSAVPAYLTVAGCVPLPDRESLVRRLDPAPGGGLVAELAAAERRLAEQCGTDLRKRRALGRDVVAAALDRAGSGGLLSDDEAADLAVAVTDRTVRDHAWQTTVARPRAPHDDDLWLDLVRRVTDRYVAAPATLLALAAWRAGDGVTALTAAERALAARPGYSLANLVRQALLAGLPPSVLDENPLTVGP